jgi:hypothetical protein
MVFLQKFVSEQLVIAVAYQDGEWLGSWTVDLGTESLDDLHVEPGEMVKIHSWLGRFDLEILGR